MNPRALPLFLLASALSFAARAAAGVDCYALRPTQPDAEWSYAGAAAAVFDTPEGNVRVWYALEGPHAPAGAAAAQVPSAALAAGTAAEAALSRFTALGFRPPLSDAPASPCVDTGGDGRLDIYLYDFAAADGTIALDQCVALGTMGCAGFAIVENDFVDKGYASAAQGFQTVVPHELFHLVQYAYSSTSEAWWAEGTAQWAAKLVFPELQDLERFLPAFFQRTDRPLDFPAVGVAASFSYGAVIWPVFLTERFGVPIVRGVFEASGERGTGALQAAETTLRREGSSLDAAFSDFATWNAATGARAGSTGYADASRYPEVTLEELPFAAPSKTVGALAGLSARYFHFPAGGRRHLEVTGDTDRVSAKLVPLFENRARLNEVEELPLEASDAAILVLSGRATDHRDVFFTIRIDDASDSVVGPPGGDVASSGAAGTSDAGAGGAVEPTQGQGGMAEVSQPVEPSDSATPDAGEVTTRSRGRSSSGCSTASTLPSRPSPATILASLGVGVGLGRLAEKTWRRRAASPNHSDRRLRTSRGGAFEYRH